MQMIDVKAAREFVETNYICDPLLRHMFLNLLEKVPKVEVVRCKDCICWMKDDPIDNFGYCINPDGIDNYAKPDDFCSYG